MFRWLGLLLEGRGTGPGRCDPVGRNGGEAGRLGCCGRTTSSGRETGRCGEDPLRPGCLELRFEEGLDDEVSPGRGRLTIIRGRGACLGAAGFCLLGTLGRSSGIEEARATV